jgi:hypothetical protein
MLQDKDHQTIEYQVYISNLTILVFLRLSVIYCDYQMLVIHEYQNCEIDCLSLNTFYNELL